jgi:hypothetical protein
MGAELNLYIEVTDYMIGFSCDVESRANKLIGFLNVADTSYKTQDCHTTETIPAPTTYHGCV